MTTLSFKRLGGFFNIFLTQNICISHFFFVYYGILIERGKCDNLKYSFRHTIIYTIFSINFINIF